MVLLGARRRNVTMNHYLSIDLAPHLSPKPLHFAVSSAVCDEGWSYLSGLELHFGLFAAAFDEQSSPAMSSPGSDDQLCMVRHEAC